MTLEQEFEQELEGLEDLIKPHDVSPIRQQLRDDLARDMKTLGEAFVKASCVFNVGDEGAMRVLIKQARERLNQLETRVKIAKDIGFKRGIK